MAFGFIGNADCDAWARKMIEAERAAHEKRSGAVLPNKKADDLIIELVEKHYGSGKALQAADILKKRNIMVLKPAARLEVERVLEVYSQKPIVFYDESEFIPASHFGSVSYLDIVVFYSLSKLYPCARVNGKLYLIKLSNGG